MPDVNKEELEITPPASDSSSEEPKPDEEGEKPNESEEKDYEALWKEEAKKTKNLTEALRQAREKKESLEVPPVIPNNREEKPPADYIIEVAKRDFNKSWKEVFNRFADEHPELQDKNLFERFKEEAVMRGQYLLNRIKNSPDALFTGDEIMGAFAKALRVVSPESPKEDLEKGSFEESRANIPGLSSKPIQPSTPLSPAEKIAAKKAGVSEKDYAKYKGEGELVIE